jgi:hypothetical protein
MKKPVQDYIVDVLEEKGAMEASRLKDCLFERIGGRTPSIRGLVWMLKKDERFWSRDAPAGETQIKTWGIKKSQKKNY